jgi:hypothetical protein
MGRKRAPGAGRKPVGEFSGKSAAFSTRITPELRESLEAESDRTGKSISQIAERRLRESFERPRRTEMVFGPAHIRALAYSVARIASHIETGTGRQWNKDQFSIVALKTALEILLNYFSPREAVVVPDRVIEQIERSGVREWMKDAHAFGEQKCLDFFGAVEYLEMKGDPAQWAYHDAELEEFLRDESVLTFIAKYLQIRVKS